MAGREVLVGVVALLVGVATLTACERSPAPLRPPDSSVASADTTPESSSEVITDTAPTPATSTDQATGKTSSAGGGGSDRTDGADGTSDGTSDGSSGGGAVGSPIDVPTIPDPHTSMDGLRSAIEGAFVAACGGDVLCVHLEYSDGACLLGYSPSTTAARGSTVKVLTESQDECDAANNGTPEPTDGPTDTPSGGASTGDSSGASSGGATDGSTSTSASGLGSGP
ncbi:hypothetical protein [Intrasporangium sp. YIM S08009]|uniref:hypothetical protein n=1 Tax=Intrasporangium zincisolvens TaxID=3080018 RepID=UPI002B05FBFB|nr:hypothetical protein [Intrasporangium sp. YIM S08009]